MIKAGHYVDFLATEYLTGYVDAGGAAVKLVVPADPTAGKQVSAALADMSNGYSCAVVDAATTRTHLVHELFFTVAGQVDWVSLAARVVHRAYLRAGFEPADDQHLAVGEVARFQDVDAAELNRSVRRQLEHAVLGDVGLAQEFRTAMFRLCQAVLGMGDVTGIERNAVLEWLTGKKVPAAQLRPLGLYARLARHNARAMLISLTRWVRVAGDPGMVLLVDLDRLVIERRPPVGQRDGHYYTKGSVLDTYEVIRQLIDSVDELEGVLAVVLVPPELLTNEKRGVEAYQALWMRIADEVRDRRRDNPYAALARVEA